jgi:excisionase family DNA binding protein
MNDTNPTETLTLAQTAGLLGLGAMEIRRLVRTEQLPVIREGRKIRIPAQFIRDMLAKSWA